MDTHSFGNVDNQFDIGIIVIVGASRNLCRQPLAGASSESKPSSSYLTIVVRHSNVVGIGSQIVRGGHHSKLDGPLVAKGLVCPFSHRSDLLDGRNTVVGDQNLRTKVRSAVP